MLSDRNTAIDHIMERKDVLNSFLRCHLGELLGEGAFRYVFQHPEKKNRVIKIDVGQSLSNATEFNIWNDIKDIPDVAKWFAPVHECTPDGRILIMEKVDTTRRIEDYPKMVPSFFGDVKWNNFGFIKDQFVCIDYAINSMYVTGAKVKLVKANW